MFGATRNPYDTSRSAGGSSGGAAAALAARMIALADGSDLGGSLRNPASFCNVVGLRPSPGRVPAWPVSDVADWLSVEGPMARTVADVALFLAVISGPDPRVPLALDAPPPALTDPGQVHGLLARDLRGVRVAWSPDLGGLPVDPAVRAALAPARQVLADLGCEVVDATPDLTGADEGFRIWRALKYATAFGPLLAARPDDVGPNVDVERPARARARGGRPEPGDPAAAPALAERISAFFETVDVLACPVSQVPPFDVDLDWVHEIDGVPQDSYLDWMRSAYLISATGLPAISVPAGLHRRPACRSACSWSAGAAATGSCCRSRTRSSTATGYGRTEPPAARRRRSQRPRRFLSRLPSAAGAGHRREPLGLRPQHAVLLVGQVDVRGRDVGLELRDRGRSGDRHHDRVADHPGQRDLRRASRSAPRRSGAARRSGPWPSPGSQAGTARCWP